MDNQQSWYIPRPSLSSNSGIKFYHRDSEMLDGEKGKERNATMSSTSSSSIVSSSHHSYKNNKMHITQETCIDCDSNMQQHNNRGRGSRSSQGSSDSEQSIHVIINV
ncbi:hypothetical protein PVAND_010479 [Polypedilum vanderplanki]|uniref:Uncharacterized protein n=1 Tax=Polypedilum vanderplanki TaxID=319348 RepID=A0A9J6CG23_POLVA|nr:hypothetical protein PVAND_010479 [Polypedilum vanderplanki]